MSGLMRWLERAILLKRATHIKRATQIMRALDRTANLAIDTNPDDRARAKADFQMLVLEAYLLDQSQKFHWRGALGMPDIGDPVVGHVFEAVWQQRQNEKARSPS